MEVEVFIFDLFGVIISFDDDIVYSRLARHCADPADARLQLKGLMAARDVITGKSTLTQVHRRLVDSYGLTLSLPQFEAAWLEPYSEAMPGMAELVARLSGQYKLALLSNVDRYYWDVVRTMHAELEHFGSILLSCDLGLAKPDPEIFLLASRVVGASPQRCYFVADTRVNVDAAAALGFQTHWFRDVDRLDAELVRANVRGAGVVRRSLDQ